ncbi:hypothetical protein BRC83_01855 [Halobacteriales archaeon QS_1_68_17]|nr:MAG: hypothetical protein BRC83_01855 [Halobacteriales archaeon QS_1_68_17]
MGTHSTRFRSTYDWQQDSPVGAVVNAVSRASGTDPMALPPLYRAVDPDALDGLVAADDRSADHDLRVTFRFAGYAVTVTGTGVVELFEDSEHSEKSGESEESTAG